MDRKDDSYPPFANTCSFFSAIVPAVVSINEIMVEIIPKYMNSKKKFFFLGCVSKSFGKVSHCSLGRLEFDRLVHIHNIYQCYSHLLLTNKISSVFLQVRNAWTMVKREKVNFILTIIFIFFLGSLAWRR